MTCPTDLSRADETARPGPSWPIALTLLAGILVVSCVLVSTKTTEGPLAEPTNTNISALVERLRNKDEALWKPAAEELVKIGPAVAWPVAKLFTEAPADGRALGVLKKLAKHREVQEVMIEGLTHGSIKVVHCSLIVLGHSGNRELVEVITPLLRKGSITAIIALGQLGGDEAFEALARELDEGNVVPRWLVAETLAKIGGPKAIPHLKEALKKIDAKTLSTAPRILNAIRKVEQAEGKQGPAGRYGFALHAVGDRNWSMLEAYDLDRMDVQYILPFRPESTNKKTRAKALKSLLTKTTGHLAWDMHGGNRLLAFHGLQLAPLTLEVPPNYDISDSHRFFHQSKLAKLVELHNKSADISVPAQGMRAYPFKEGDSFIALLPGGRLFWIYVGRISDQTRESMRHSAVHLSLMPLDPLYALIPPKAYQSVRVPATPPATEPAEDWGKAVNGLQSGLRFGRQGRDYRMGELVVFALLVRNTGDKTVTLVDYVPLTGWAPTVRAIDGKLLLVAVPPMDRPVQARRSVLKPGDIFEVGTVSLQLDASAEERGPTPHVYLTPGKYVVSQVYRFADAEDATWSGELTTGNLTLSVAAADKRSEIEVPVTQPGEKPRREKS